MRAIDAGNILRMFKNLGFSTHHQLHLYESDTGFHIVGQNTDGTPTDRPASPQETDVIIALLATGQLIRVQEQRILGCGQTAEKIVLKVDLNADHSLRSAAGQPLWMPLLYKMISRRGNPDYRGIVHQDLSNNPYQKQPYAWMYYAGMGEVGYHDVAPGDIPMIEAMLAEGILKKGHTYRRPLINGHEEVTTELSLTI